MSPRPLGAVTPRRRQPDGRPFGAPRGRPGAARPRKAPRRPRRRVNQAGSRCALTGRRGREPRTETASGPSDPAPDREEGEVFRRPKGPGWVGKARTPAMGIDPLDKAWSAMGLCQQATPLRIQGSSPRALPRGPPPREAMSAGPFPPPPLRKPAPPRGRGPDPSPRGRGLRAPWNGPPITPPSRARPAPRPSPGRGTWGPRAPPPPGGPSTGGPQARGRTFVASRSPRGAARPRRDRRESERSPPGLRPRRAGGDPATARG